jgi:hypothetical protein
MPLIRILVDGYSLLHAWPALEPTKARHSEQARTALVRVLSEYQTRLGTPITVFFDGQGRKPTVSKEAGEPVEVIFSKSGQTADDLIERAAYRFREYGPVLVVTDDFAERDLVTGFGGLCSSCATFIAQIEGEMDQTRRDLARINRRERQVFRRRG